MEAPSLRTKRFVLSPLASADLDQAAALYADPRVMHHIEGGTCDRVTTANLLLVNERCWKAEGWGMWAVRDATSGAFLGQGGLQRTADRHGVEAEFSMLVSWRNWRKGVATEAGNALLSDAWERFTGNEILAFLHPDNTAGAPMLRKLGFKRFDDRGEHLAVSRPASGLRRGRSPHLLVDHEAVYAAELAAFEGTDLEDVRAFGEICGLIDAVVATVWWQGGQVDVRRARTDAGSSSTRGRKGAGRSGATISLASAQMTVATAIHELAHVLAGPGHGHDALYRRAYLDVAQVATNLDSTDRRLNLHVQQLADAFAAAGLAVGERSWPSPSDQFGSAIAL